MVRFLFMFTGILVIGFSCGMNVVHAQQGRSGFRVPEVGTLLPGITVFDAQGNEFSTDSLRKHYSVLVFGCLT